MKKKKNIFGYDGPDILHMPGHDGDEGSRAKALKRVGSARLELIQASDDIENDDERSLLWKILGRLDNLRWELRRKRKMR